MNVKEGMYPYIRKKITGGSIQILLKWLIAIIILTHAKYYLKFAIYYYLINLYIYCKGNDTCSEGYYGVLCE